ncbi:F-box domain protein [Aspergillus steynii IBT 23096]|uniref:F-box domain protein n=1 Tax=Aspergillus steynii IBT 23096 TaxID=1392250 RepID=A0A2I2FYJ8_9EURO|nr:F-box domain protein [Aspergillus steynii IBT 23096]PLB45713.1 F-box domain protein [Aspergillus steynii IBT 23096]
MHASPPIYLPTEIILQIVGFIAADESCRQEALHSCCLVSRQWYSAAIAPLYEKPHVGTGVAFGRFTDTISPPIGARKSKLNLGSLVHRLDLSGLVHHSSNSLTARLLGRVKENLEIFIAPKVSFSINSLPALSKCVNLRSLDLSLVGDPIPFTNLKQALSRLRKLSTLRLPRSTILTPPESSSASQAIEWPPQLTRLQLSGRFNPLTIPTFAWPLSLTSLSLKNCSDLSVSNLGSLMSSPYLNHSLQRLSISGANRGLQPESVNAILAFLPRLTTLSIPGDMVEDTFFEILCHMAPAVALEVLEFSYPSLDPNLVFSTEALIRALGSGLANLRAVGFADLFCTEQRVEEDEDVEEILQKRAAERSGEGGYEEREDLLVGVYYI